MGKREDEEEEAKKPPPDMKLTGPNEDPETGLRFDVRYGDDVVDPKTGLRFDTKYEPKPAPYADQGPPQAERPWDKWTPEQKAKYEKALEVADGVKLYRSAGGIGVNAQYGPQSRALEQRGGLSPEEALELARYRMWKQGDKDVPTGARAPALTEAEIGARREAFIAAKGEERARMMDEDKRAIARSSEGYFDSLVRPREAKPEPKDIDDEALKAAKAIISKGRINRPEKKVSGNKSTDALLRSMGKVKG